MSEVKVLPEDRLLEHYTDVMMANMLRQDGIKANREVVRDMIDTSPRYQVKLGRTDGGYGYLRALIIAGIATDEERNWLSEFAG